MKLVDEFAHQDGVVHNAHNTEENVTPFAKVSAMDRVIRIALTALD